MVNDNEIIQINVIKTVTLFDVSVCCCLVDKQSNITLETAAEPKTHCSCRREAVQLYV